MLTDFADRRIVAITARGWAVAQALLEDGPRPGTERLKGDHICNFD
jgi:hypothetical protein